MANRSLTEITIHILEVVKGYGDNEGLSLTNIIEEDDTTKLLGYAKSNHRNQNAPGGR